MRRFLDIPDLRIPTVSTDVTKVKTYIIAGACSLALLASLVVAGVAFNQRFDATNARAAQQRLINKAVCTSVINLDSQITATLHRSLVNLPKIAYFKTHPQELKDQLTQVRQSIATFVPPTACAIAIHGGKS